jgi:hypothetical protein
MGIFIGKECTVEHFSVSIVQHSDGIATVAYIGLDGSVYRFEVSADRAMLFSAQLIGWARYCMAFDPVYEGR